jgi:hypothetical protein
VGLAQLLCSLQESLAASNDAWLFIPVTFDVIDLGSVLQVVDERLEDINIDRGRLLDFARAELLEELDISLTQSALYAVSALDKIRQLAVAVIGHPPSVVEWYLHIIFLPLVSCCSPMLRNR